MYFNMSLQEAVQSQQEKYPTAKCDECGNQANLGRFPFALYGITVLDFPMYQCECGHSFRRASIGMAVENVKDKQKLHGAYTIEQLVQIENEEIVRN